MSASGGQEADATSLRLGAHVQEHRPSKKAWSAHGQICCSFGGGQEADATSLRLGAHVQELIPGLPDEITLGKVVTKLRRIDIDTLFFVNRSWFHAIRSRQVYDARVLAHSTETYLIANYSPAENVHGMILYSTTKDPAHPHLELPSLRSPYFGRDVPPDGRSVMLDGKVYVFGELDCKVHVMDVAGHRQWKQCADMLRPKVEFGCGTIDGKIYIFGGGVFHESLTSVSAVYNPKDNTWPRIRKIVSLRSSDRTIDSLISTYCSARVRKEVRLRVGGGEFLHPNVWSGRECCLRVGAGEFLHPNVWSRRKFWSTIKPPPKNSDPLEVYDPIKDKWRVVEPVRTSKEIMFVAGGKFFSMSPRGVHIYDFYRNSWGDLHSFSFVGFGPVDPVNIIFPVAILSDDVEVLAIVDWSDAGTNRSFLMQSRGFGSQNKEIVWYEPEYSAKQPHRTTLYLNHLIEL